ncbi:MAG: hypothetical protein ABJA81_01635 [Nocardioidaceae bacterium]
MSDQRTPDESRKTSSETRTIALTGDEGSHRGEDSIDRHEEAEAVRHDKFGGYNIGADFFGWLVAIALAVLLASIVGAIAAAVGSSLEVDQTDAERSAGTIGLATAIALLVILMIGYYAGGYVAGRMSRYDGGRQGVGVWIIGFVVTLIAIGLGALFGTQYNIMDRVDLPSIPIPRDTLTTGGVIAAVAVLVGTLLAALAGGKVGQRYHRKVDRTGL